MLTTKIEKQKQGPKTASKRHPHAPARPSALAINEDPGIDAVFIATPISSHYDVAKAALSRAGKHVLVTKPLAASSEEAHDLVSITGREKRVLMVDHTFIYTRIPGPGGKKY